MIKLFLLLIIGPPIHALVYVFDFLSVNCIKMHDFLSKINNNLLDKEGLTEHGGSVDCSWLSKKGEDLLKKWREHDESNN